MDIHFESNGTVISATGIRRYKFIDDLFSKFVYLLSTSQEDMEKQIGFQHKEKDDGCA